MSNIYDIAAETGFSPATVARALGGRGYVGKATKEKILAAAQSLHYTPNDSARSLRSKRTYKILMCVPDLYNAFYFDMIKGANQILEQHGYFIMLCHSKHSLSEELKIINMLKERYGDGIIFVSFDFNETNVNALAATRMPVVATNRILQDVSMDYVYIDHTRATYLAARHLIESGHTEIGILIGDLREQTSRERLDGYRQALTESQLPFSEERVLVSNYTREYTHEVLRRHLARKGGGLGMTALVAGNALMGVGCMDVCAERGIALPDRLSIIALDNTDITTCTSPRLSVMDMKQEEIGKHAARLLLEQIEGRAEKKKTVTLEPSLILRESAR